MLKNKYNITASNQEPSAFNVSAQANSANQTGINMTPTQWASGKNLVTFYANTFY
jgi:hypothetical protein